MNELDAKIIGAAFDDVIIALGRLRTALVGAAQPAIAPTNSVPAFSSAGQNEAAAGVVSAGPRLAMDSQQTQAVDAEVPPPAFSRPAKPGPKAGLWTPERDALCKIHYPDGIDVAALMVMLNKLPGEQIINKKQVENRCVARLDLKRKNPRNAGRVAAARPATTPVTAPVPAPVLSPPPPPAPLKKPAPPVVSAKPPVPLKMSPEILATIVRTPDRSAKLRVMYVDEQISLETIIAALNNLPGKKITSAETVRQWAKEFHLQRGAVTAGNQYANLENVRAWAAERGLCNGNEKLDITRVNAKRVQLGLPQFVVLAGARHA